MRNATRKAAIYTVLDGGTMRDGIAKNVLDQIRKQGAKKNDELEKMNVDEYADALIADAEYFISEKVMGKLKTLAFPTKYDRALAYLSAEPSSGVKILQERN